MSTTTLRSFSMSSMEEETPVMEDRRKVVVAMDGSDHSMYALNCKYILLFYSRVYASLVISW